MSATKPANSVWAVVVTYNRPALLRRSIDAIQAQIRLPDGILVVDNASDEPASQVLAAYSGLTHIRVDKNAGGAGGFYLGMKSAFANGAGAVWLMDDDGAPDPDGLAKLLEAAGEKAIILNPLVINQDVPDQLSFGLDIGPKLVFDVAEARALAADGVLVGPANAFNGTLVTASAYQRVGDIKFECFIWGDEAEYILRAGRAGVVVGTAVNSVHRHPAPKASMVDLGPLGTIKVCPPQRAHYHYRNLGYLMRYHGSPAKALAKGLVHVGYYTLTGQFAEAGKFIRYYLDGARNQYALSPSRADLRAMTDLPSATSGIQAPVTDTTVAGVAST